MDNTVITARKQSNNMDQERDHLSGLWNRRAGEKLLQQALLKSERSGEPFVVALVDINDMRDINERYSHREGDKVIVQVGDVLKQTLKENDAAIRFSGDKFLLLYHQDKETVSRILHTVNQELDAISTHKPYPIQLCYGYVQVQPQQGMSLSSIIIQADNEMYEWKRRYHVEKSRAAFAAKPYHMSGEVEQFTYDTTRILNALMQSSDDYIYVCNMKDDPQTFRYSPAMVKEFALPSEIVHDAANVWGAKIHEADQKAFLEGNQEIADGRVDVHNVEYRALNKDGKWVWLRCRGHVERNVDGEPVLFAGIITNLERKNKIDPLTGQFNKFELEETLSQIVTREEPFFLIMLDLDGFANINKLFNHRFGDQVLSRTAQLMQSVLPCNAKLFRNDGDEFFIILRDTANQQEVTALYENLQQMLSGQQILDHKKYHCSVSAGCVAFPQDTQDLMSLTKYVGYALEKSKRSGKNRLSFYEKKMQEQESMSLNLLEQLRYSMEHDYEGFYLAFQPQVDAISGRILGAEALARWSCDMYGNVPPLTFIPLLEKSGLIIPVGKWIFEEAVKQCSIWEKRFSQFRVSVNLSYLQLNDESFISFMKEMLEKYKIQGKNIVVEMTESHMVKNGEELRAIFHEIRNIGIRIAMDDFGTGYSSLGVLKNSPADIVKIDKIFMKDVLHSNFDATFIRFVVHLCHDVGIQVLLEGVETKEEYEKVRLMGLDYIQGYYFGKPMRADALEKLL